MSDELDPDVSRWFASANQPLADAEFRARIVSQLQQTSSWLGSGYSSRELLQAALAGVAAGILTPFKLRPGYTIALVVWALAFTVWIGL